MTDPVDNPVSSSPNKPQAEGLGFVPSVLLIMASLFTARWIANALGFTNNRVFSDDMNLLHTLVYFAIGVSLYVVGAFTIQFIKSYRLRRQAAQSSNR
jgi:hypothetical protein